MKHWVGFIFFLVGISGLHAQSLPLVGEKSHVSFTIKNFGVSTSGGFTGLQGNFQYEPAAPDKMLVEASVDANSVNTDVESRDNHLRKAEYFDIIHFPRISLRSERITPGSKPGAYTLNGKLTIKAVTRDISFPFTVDPRADGYLLEGTFQINRRDFQVGGNSLLLGDIVTVRLSVFAKKP